MHQPRLTWLNTPHTIVCSPDDLYDSWKKSRISLSPRTFHWTNVNAAALFWVSEIMWACYVSSMNTFFVCYAAFPLSQCILHPCAAHLPCRVRLNCSNIDIRKCKVKLNGSHFCSNVIFSRMKSSYKRKSFCQFTWWNLYGIAGADCFVTLNCPSFFLSINSHINFHSCRPLHTLNIWRQKYLLLTFS